MTTAPRRAKQRLLSSALVLGAAALPMMGASIPGPAMAQERGVAVLLEQANYWRLQNRPDQVVRVVDRLLAVDPRNPAALAAGAEAHAQLGDRQAADAMLARLRQSSPADPRVAEADLVVRGATVDAGQVAEARRLAQGGRSAEAIEQYRSLFRGAAVPDAFALEYYQTLAGLPQHRQEALDGLARLQQRSPSDRRIALTHAQVLTYGEATRADGIARLDRLSQSPDTAQSASTAWRQAILWQPSVPALVPQIEAFLQRFPNDAAMQEKLAESRSSRGAPRDSVGEQRAGGFELLRAGRVTEAEAAFQAVLAAHADDPDALGGLGLVRMRQRRNAEARQLLGRAIELDPAEGRQKWGAAFAGAAPRGGEAVPASPEIVQARGLLARQQDEEAEALLRRALRRDLPDRADAEAMLGDITMRRGDPTGAEQRYRAALARRPDFSPALSGLYAALQSQGRFAEAEEILRRRGSGAGGSAGQLRAQALRVEAGRTDDPEAAIALLRGAMSAEPENPWIRLDLARLMLRTGRGQDARALMQEPLAAANPPVDQIHAAALFADEDGRSAEAQQLIERIPPRLRTPDQTRMLARSRVVAEVRSAASLASFGRMPEARQRLMAIAGRPDPGGEATMAVVRAFQGMNDPRGAQEAARLAHVTNRGAPPQARLAIASALLEAGLEQEAALAARELEAGARLSPEERRQVMALQSGLAVRVSDRLNARGEQAAAYDQLAPALARDPTNPGTNLALARLYQGARDPRQAQQIAEAVLQRDPRNTDARQAAIDAATALRDWRRAETLLAEGRALMPNDPRLPLMEARLARAGGDPRRARQALEMAAEQRRSQLGVEGGVGAMAPGASGGMSATPTSGFDNPFRRVPLAGQGGIPVLQPAPADPMLSEINRQLVEVREEGAPRVTPSFGVRARSGDPGMDRLGEVSAGAEGSMALPGLGGRLALQATAVSINSGDLDQSLSALRRFGGNALTLPGATGTLTAAQARAASASDGSASGAALGLAYSRPNFQADIGSTPIGFQQQNIVGGIELSPELADGLRLRVIGERRAITDSVLSWAGLRDPAFNRNWGGVVRNTLRAQLEFSSSPDTSFYLGGGYSTVSGTGVASNTRVEAGAGVQHVLRRGDDDELTTGLNLVYFAYDKNLRMFSLGHGGYFSPQSFMAATIPLDYRVRSGNLAWRIGGSLGISSFREDRAPVFPNDAALQAALEARAAASGDLVASYAGQSASGVSGGLRGDIEYALTPQLRVGALLRYDRSADWDEGRGLLYARYRFDR